MATPRHLHILGATGTIRTAMHDGREHIVVPVVALMEGVIHAVNAETPEFVPFKALSVNPARWDGQPVVLNHPARNGVQISAKEPGVFDAQGLGKIFKTCIKGKKLCLEAWIDPQQASKFDAGRRLLERVKRNEQIEVSVGAYVTTLKNAGNHNGKPYKAEWNTIEPDHLAFLPDGVGACSIEMGCGAHRAAAMNTTHLVTAQGFETLGDGEPITTPRSLRERLTALMKSAGTKYTEPIPAEEKPELKAACGCKHGVNDMDKTKRIAALAANDHCPIKDIKVLETMSDDALKALEFNAEEMAKLKKKSEDDDAEKKTADEKLKAAEAALKTAQEAPITIERLPDNIKQIVEAHTLRTAEEKKALVDSLKTAAAGVYTEEQLNAMDVQTLTNLAKFAKVETPAPANFGGQGIPRVLTAPVPNTEFAPPDAYAPTLTALAAQK